MNRTHSLHHTEEDKGKRLRIKSHEATNKPKRKRITPYQFNVLSDLFLSTDTPNYQLREKTAEKLNMTNREVQVWFQNRRAKVNRGRLQEQRRHDPFIYPICWTPPQHHHQHQHQQHPNQHKFHTMFQEVEPHYDSQSSVTSSNSSTPTLYPQLSPHMRPIDILALAAEYVQRCDEEKRLTEERRKCWRPWV
ncbi:hypothetical protein MFLAVUS_003299 [Mucor flavus]|uniref:Homeobox domain-containing protein n=1 Tax=Mucor flavus TaxID=439312 RepID=A0ABP9YSQ0_9FUNG